MLYIFLAGFISCQGRINQNQAEAVSAAGEDRVEVIDFYGTHRCVTCEAIESNTQYTVETFFADELKSGKVTFQAVNVDLDENIDLARQFEVAGTALFLNVIDEGESRQIDLTSLAFAKGVDKEAFSAELREMIEAQLNTL